MGVCRIGLDLGGTKMCAVAVDRTNRIVAGPMETATERERYPQAILDDMAALIERLQAQAPGRATGIGVGLPTTVDGEGGLVPCPNLPTMGGVKIRPELESRLGRRVVLDNDANCYAYGEWRAGAGQGSQHCCCLTLGTGLGMGVVLGGQLYHGSHGSAGELCYSPLGSGREVEDVVSGIGVSRRYNELTGAELDAAAIAELARAGDRDALTVWQEVGEALGFALAYTVNILDPEVVVLGGSLAGAWDLFDGPMQGVLESHAYNRQAFALRGSALGRQGAAIGAALLPGV